MGVAREALTVGALVEVHYFPDNLAKGDATLYPRRFTGRVVARYPTCVLIDTGRYCTTVHREDIRCGLARITDMRGGMRLWWV